MVLKSHGVKCLFSFYVCIIQIFKPFTIIKLRFWSINKLVMNKLNKQMNVEIFDYWKKKSNY